MGVSWALQERKPEPGHISTELQRHRSLIPNNLCLGLGRVHISHLSPFGISSVHLQHLCTALQEYSHKKTKIQQLENGKFKTTIIK